MGAVAHRTERGIQHLRNLGFEVVLADHAMNQAGDVSDTPEHRAEDLHQMFGDLDIRAIISGIGGDHSCHLLPLLDFQLIAAIPKVFMGFLGHHCPQPGDMVKEWPRHLQWTCPPHRLRRISGHVRLHRAVFH